MTTLSLNSLGAVSSLALEESAVSSAMMAAGGGSEPPAPGDLPPCPPSPPPPPPGGGGSDRKTPSSALMTDLRRLSANTKSRLLADALNELLTVNDLQSTHAAVSRVTPQLDQVTSLFAQAVYREMDLIPQQEWVFVASAIFATGKMILRNGESASQVTDLFRSIALFSAVSEEPGASKAGAPDFVHQDHLLAKTVMPLKGWLPSNAMPIDKGRSLGRLLTRYGIILGSNHWPQQKGPSFPNLLGALWTLYDNSYSPDPSNTARTQAYGHFEAAAAWHQSASGYIDQALAGILEGRPFLEIERLSNHLKNQYQEDKDAQRVAFILNDYLKEISGEEAITRIVEVAGDGLRLSRARPSLASFLQVALQELQ